ncbi:hypothetical protein VQL36_09340 [Chengkuizengella sp. SCS-71B]|uniref:hypothetical protein n=1 Tax=Chengkuizengella sp. SCS-71B TaxID=3115290 RepID=UPI0032C20F7B
MDFHYLIGSSEGIEHVTERHEMGLFSIQDMKEAFKSAGLQVQHDSKGISGRGMYIGSK